MKLIKGLIRNTDLDKRIFELKTKNKIYNLYLTRSVMNKVKLYLQENNYCELICNDDFLIKDNMILYEVIAFLKITGLTNNLVVSFYDINDLKKGIKDVINKESPKMFIDLEFTMPEYGSHGTFQSDIIEFGFIIEDNDGKVLEKETSLIKVANFDKVSNRTFAFINKDIYDFDDSKSPQEFYQIFKEALIKYNPTIMVWGTGDILMLDNFYKRYQLEPITSRSSFMNIMQIIKNYFGLKYDLGLFKALNYFDKSFNTEQIHDALVDAEVTSRVFHLVKEHINREEK